MSGYMVVGGRNLAWAFVQAHLADAVVSRQAAYCPHMVYLN
jgi:hypothetical protein